MEVGTPFGLAWEEITVRERVEVDRRPEFRGREADGAEAVRDAGEGPRVAVGIQVVAGDGHEREYVG
jgi:hypothetical protein